MAIDINQPVEPGHDMVLNYEDGRQELGTGATLEEKVAKGQIIGLHLNPKVVDGGTGLPVRDSKGHFVKK